MSRAATTKLLLNRVILKSCGSPIDQMNEETDLTARLFYGRVGGVSTSKRRGTTIHLYSHCI
jgi:hypothetical protein